jgi:hypothetical protein
MHHKPLSVLNSVKDVPGPYRTPTPPLPPPLSSDAQENNNVTLNRHLKAPIETNNLAMHPVSADNRQDSKEPTGPTAHHEYIVWQKVDRSAEGFRVEMPIDVKQIQIPAYNETGGTDLVNMIFSNPDAETTFSVAWADNPPVARVNKRSPGRTLQMAQEGAVARTQTTLTDEAASTTPAKPKPEETEVWIARAGKS